MSEVDPQQPIHIHMPGNGGSAVKVAIIGAFALIAVGVLGVFGDQMFGAIADVAASVSDVHDLANSNLEAQRQIAEVLRAELATANERIAELSERIGGMVPAPPPVEGTTP